MSLTEPVDQALDHFKEDYGIENSLTSLIQLRSDITQLIANEDDAANRQRWLAHYNMLGRYYNLLIKLKQ